MNNNDLFLVRYSTSEASVLGFQQGREFNALAFDSDGQTHKLNGLGSRAGQPVSLDWLLSDAAPPAAELSEMLGRLARESVELWSINPNTPIGTQEVWAAGVTYKRSEEAREAESNNSTIYTRVYSAARPELFFKSNGGEVVPLGEPVGIRCDATWSVPEPELVVVINSRMEVVGFTIGNDMSSRDIEGENPLYLPQAKNYDRACALGPRIWLQPGATRFPDVDIELKIERAGEVVFSGNTSSEQIHRPLAELVEYLGRCKSFPHGAMLFTGTGIVPPDSFTLLEGDKVRIRIDPIGELINTVTVVGKRTGNGT